MAEVEFRMVRWFAPEWLASYDGALGSACSRSALTPKDHALALGLIGALSSVEYDVCSASDAGPVTSIREARTADLKSIEDRVAIDEVFWPGQFRRQLNLPKTADLARCAGRIEGMLCRDGRMFHSVEVSSSVISVRFGVSTLLAHPLNSGKNQALAIDVSAMASMSCSQSVPIALRAAVWLRSKVRTGLRYLPNRWVGSEFVVDVPTDRLPSALGLSMRGFKVGEFTKLLPAIESDLRMLGIGAKLEWLRNGRSADALRLRLKNLGAHQSASPSITDPKRRPAAGRPFRIAPDAPPQPKRKYVRKPRAEVAAEIPAPQAELPSAISAFLSELADGVDAPISATAPPAPEPALPSWTEDEEAAEAYFRAEFIRLSGATVDANGDVIVPDDYSMPDPEYEYE